jgi:hypothetical protein
MTRLVHAITTDFFDYSPEAELFSTRPRSSRHHPLGYKRSVRAADGVRYAIEDLPPELLVRTCLEVNESRCEGTEIHRLHASAHQSLARVGESLR